MRLVLFNGSGKGKRANSIRLMRAFYKGFHKTPGHEVEEIHLSKKYTQEELRKKYLSADKVIFITPLFSDQPHANGIKFIEALQPLCNSSEKKPPIGLIVHGAFPEPRSMIEISKYSRRLCEMLGAEWLGALAPGASEGIRLVWPAEMMTIPNFLFLRKWGKYFGKHEDFKKNIHVFNPYPWFGGRKMYLFWFLNGAKYIFFYPQFWKSKLSMKQVDAQPYKEQ